jgi:hypothetical protein
MDDLEGGNSLSMWIWMNLLDLSAVRQFGRLGITAVRVSPHGELRGADEGMWVNCGVGDCWI